MAAETKSSAASEAGSPSDEGEEDEDAHLEPQKKTTIDKVHERVDHEIIRTAVWIDSFFADERSLVEDNQTRLRLKLDTFVEEGEPVGFDAKADFKLVLPAFEERFQLIFSGDPDEDLGIESDPISQPPGPEQEADEEQVTATLRYFALDTLKKNLSFSAGFRLKDFNVIYFPEVRYRQSFEFDPFDMRFQQRVRWYSDKGWESKTRFDFEREFKERKLLRATTEGVWYEDQSGFYYSLGLTLYQPLSRKRVLSYECSNNLRTYPNNHLTQSLIKVRYRQRIWRKWLFFEVAPQIKFPEFKDYRPTPGILVRFEINMGAEDRG
jgi:hypothetical protein